jgi:hypothetical protein
MPVRYVVVRTDVRALTAADLAAAIAGSGHARDERTFPEPRRQMAFADTLDAAIGLARALAAVGQVRAGRQRVKIIRVS